MTALPQDVVAELKARISELEQRLQTSGAENARLERALALSRDRQQASAEILGTIADAPGDAKRALYQIAETSARLFGAPSSTIQVAEGYGWAETIRFGDISKRIGAGVPDSRLRIGGGNMPGLIVAESRQVHVPDLDNVDPAIAHWPGLPFARAGGTRSMSGSPLRREGKAIGALIIYRDRLQPFTDEEMALQQIFADQAAIAIENARLFNETKDALERQTATAEVLQVISRSAFDLGAVLQTLVEIAAKLCRADAAQIYQRDGEFYRSAVMCGKVNDSYRKIEQTGVISAGRDTLIGRVALQAQPVQIADAWTDPEYGAGEDARIGNLRSMLGVPLMRNGELIGAFALAREKMEAFADGEVELVKTFADQAVIAIENARLFNEVQQRTNDLSEALHQQTATADVLKVISRSAFDLRIVLDTLIETAVRLGGSQRGGIFFRDQDVLRLQSYFGFPDEQVALLRERPLKIGMETMAGRPALLGETVHIPDILLDPDFKNFAGQAVGKFRAFLGVPLKRDGTVFGVLAMNRPEPGPFSQRQIELVQTFADQAVIAIENVRLFDEVQAKTRDLSEALTYQTGSANILKVIASSPTDVEPVLKAIVTSACELCEADDALVTLKEGDELVFQAQHGPIPVVWQRQPIDRDGVAGRAVIDRASIHVNDLLGPDGDEFPRAREFARKTGVRTVLCVPLMREGQSIGVIVLRRTEVRPFSQKHVALLQTFADQAVIALGNVRLFEEVQAKTRDLAEALQQQTATTDVLRVISRSAFDLDVVMNTLASSAQELCASGNCAIFLLEDGIFSCRGLSAIEDSIADFMRNTPVPLDPETNMGKAVLGRCVVNVADSPNSKTNLTKFQKLIGFQSFLAVPLLREGEGVGVITLTRMIKGGFNQREIDLVQGFADQAVIAISNVRLLDQLQQRTRELAASLDELRAAQDRLIQTEKLASLGQLTAGIAHEIKNPLNFVNNFASLSAELTDELNEALASSKLADKTRAEVDELTRLLKDNLQKVVQHGKRADSIVKNMLLHSREGSGEHRPTDINALVEESLNLAYHGARAEKPQFTVTIKRELDPGAGTAELFPQEITRVLLNLISNGFYAVTKRRAENGTAGYEPVLMAATRDRGDHVEIRIRDNGTGIPEDVKQKMFNPFFTTKPAGEGTGLGLSMSHDIVVKQHAGAIDVHTLSGEFTEFTIRLPRKSAFPDKTNSPDKIRG